MGITITKTGSFEQKEYRELLGLYIERIMDADIKHAKKFQAIRDSRKFLRQILPEISENKLDSAGEIKGNNTEVSNRSKYSPPLMLAINKKMSEDLKAEQIDFEYAPNAKGGKTVSDKYMKIIQQTFSQENMMTEHIHAISTLLDSGTAIVRPISSFMTHQVLVEKENADGQTVIQPEELKSGRYLGFMSYDPIQTFIDPNADPHRVQKTAEWIVITIGKKSAEYIKQKYGKKVSFIKNLVADRSGKPSTESFLVVDSYKTELQSEAGLEDQTGYNIREYYLTNGKVYTILEDCYVINEKYNSARIYGMIPVIVCPCIVDKESPYGIPPVEELRPSVEVVATAINAVADNTTMRNKFPFVTIKGLFDPQTLEKFKSGVFNNFNDIVEISIKQLNLAPNFTVRSLKDLFVKPEIQEVTQGSMFLYNEALNNIWILTGLNPTMLSGRQDKQIRVQSVAEMINASALRSSSEVVRNIDTYYINPLCTAFQGMFYSYYDDFSEFKDANDPVSKEQISDLKAIRVVKGSYLPADQMGRMIKANFVAARVKENPLALDPIKSEQGLFKAVGINIEDYERDPLQSFSENQLAASLRIASEQGPEALVNLMKNLKQQMDQNKSQTPATTGDQGVK